MYTSQNFSLTLPLKDCDFILFPEPGNTLYHEISNVSITANRFSKLKEGVGENNILLFNRKEVEEEILITFDAILKPISTNIKDTYTVNDYKNNTYDQYLKKNSFINGNDTEIKEIARKICSSEKNLPIIVRNLYEYVIDHLTYGKPIDGLYPYSQALHEKVTDCGGFTTLLGSLLQSMDIPNRMAVGYLLKKSRFRNFLQALHILPVTLNDMTMHVWLEIFLPDGTIFPLDPSVEWRRRHGISSRKGGFGEVDADRFVLSYGEDFTVTIDQKKYKIPIFQHPQYL